MMTVAHAATRPVPATRRDSGGGRRAPVIRYSFACTSLGRILAAAGPDGLCALLIGDEPGDMLAALRRDFPAAICLPTDDPDILTVAAIQALIEDPGSRPGLQLELRGTEFQRRVWQALQAIPPGETISYGALAARLGLPRGSRAVAAACAANRIAVAIPCHRVVRADGAVSGYRWGTDRKRELLERERRLV